MNDMVLEEINAILDFAQAAPELGAEKGVHEYRKAVRRARSLIKFAADGHPEFSGRRASQALRTAFQATNPLRDGHVLEGIAEGAKDLTTPELFEFVAPLLAGTPPADEDALKILGDQTALLEQARGHLAHMWPKSFKKKHMRRGLKTSYKRAKSRLKTFRKLGTDEAFHDLRKRIKELRYQVELFSEPRVSPDAWLTEFQNDLAATAKALGQVTDLMVLSDHLHEHIPEAESWREAIRERIRTMADAAAEQVSKLLAESPKQVARRVVLHVP